MSVRIGLKFVRYDHINCSMRLPGHGKNTASSVIVFPQIIFLSIEKHLRSLTCFLFRHCERGWFWFNFFVTSCYRTSCYEHGREKKKVTQQFHESLKKETKWFGVYWNQSVFFPLNSLSFTLKLFPFVRKSIVITRWYKIALHKRLKNVLWLKLNHSFDNSAQKLTISWAEKLILLHRKAHSWTYVLIHPYSAHHEIMGI